MGRPPYQDKWRDGQLVEKGRRECAGRFAAIAEELGEVDSLIDVGGWDGYFARRFAEVGALTVLFEPRNVADLPDGVDHAQVRVDGSTEFPTCDAALALAVLHHIPDWEQVLTNLRRASRTLIVEAAVPAELDGELSPTLEQTGDRIGPITELVGDIGRTFATTPGPNGVRRPLIVIRNRQSGTVEDGRGVATKHHVTEGWPLGYDPVPGTLNLKVGRAGKSWAMRLPGAVEFDPYKLPGPYYPVTVTNSEGASIAGHVRTSAAHTVVEVVAPVNLRDELGLEDGDDVELAPA